MTVLCFYGSVLSFFTSLKVLKKSFLPAGWYQDSKAQSTALLLNRVQIFWKTLRTTNLLTFPSAAAAAFVSEIHTNKDKEKDKY